MEERKVFKWVLIFLVTRRSILETLLFFEFVFFGFFYRFILVGIRFFLFVFRVVFVFFDGNFV